VIFRALDSDPSKFECCGQLSAAVAAINEKGVLSGHGQHGYGKPYVASAVQTMLGEARASAPAAPLRGNARLLAVHAHMLRHACGYALANAGHDTRVLQDWLGHRSIQHTFRYTELSPTRFKDFWRS
jgi:integrase